MSDLLNMVRTCLMGFLLAGAASAAWSQPSPALDRVSVSVGAFRVEPVIRAGIAGDGRSLNTGDVRPDPAWVPQLRAELLLLERQGLSFDYFRYDRAVGRSLEGNASIGSGAARTSGQAEVDIRLDVVNLSWRWWLGSGSTVVGPGLGAAYYRARLEARAAAVLDTPFGSASGRVEEGFSDHAWAPLLELSVRHALTPAVRLTADVSGARRNSGTLRDSISRAAVGVEWFPSPTLGMSLDLSSEAVDIQRMRGAVDTALRVRLRGPTIAVKLRF